MMMIVGVSWSGRATHATRDVTEAGRRPTRTHLCPTRYRLSEGPPSWHATFRCNDNLCSSSYMV